MHFTAFRLPREQWLRARTFVGLCFTASRIPVDGGGESFPDFKVAGVFIEHTFGMKLKSHQKIRLGIVIGFNQSIPGMGHRLETSCEIANSLMMVAIHTQRLLAIPAFEWSSWNDGG